MHLNICGDEAHLYKGFTFFTLTTIFEYIGESSHGECLLFFASLCMIVQVNVEFSGEYLHVYMA